VVARAGVRLNASLDMRHSWPFCGGSLWRFFASVYAFVRARYESRSALWPSVKRELRLFADLLPMIFQDLRAEWSEDVIATDASEWGLGAVISRGDPAAIAASGRLCERWRFRAAEGLGGARQQAGMEVGPLGSIIEPDADGLTPAGRDWQEVPAELLKGPWKLVGRSKWQRQEHINVLEGRALCYGINRLARRSSNLGKRVLMLCDSMVVTLGN
jgi:hypothetical protein